MDPRLDDLLIALERFRDGLSRGAHDMRSARRILASFRVGLLRLRRRGVALLLSLSAWNEQLVTAAVDAAITALRAELVDQGRAA